jgi:putative polyketide hydroxylase
LWLEQRGQRISTLDLFVERFVLLTGPAGAPWCEAAPGVAAALEVDLAAYRLGADGDVLDLEDGWQARMGVSPEGAVLVRPDGFVAWCSAAMAADPESRLVQVLSSILCRSTPASRL